MIVGSAGTAFPGASNLAAQKALIAFVCIYIFFFASTWGPGKHNSLQAYQVSTINIINRGLGCYRRDISAGGQSQRTEHDYSIQLVTQLCNRILNPIPREPRPGQRRSTSQDLLRMGRLLLTLCRLCLLLDLRNEGALPRGSGRNVLEDRLGMEI